MKRVPLIILLLTIFISTASAANRNEVWIEHVDIPNEVEAGSKIRVDLKLAWEFDYDTQINPGIWNVDEEYYEEQIGNTVSGSGQRTYQIEFNAPMVNGVHEYWVEAPYLVDGIRHTADNGLIEFQIEVKGGETPSAIENILGEIAIPGFPLWAVGVGLTAMSSLLRKKD